MTTRASLPWPTLCPVTSGFFPLSRKEGPYFFFFFPHLASHLTCKSRCREFGNDQFFASWDGSPFTAPPLPLPPLLNNFRETCSLSRSALFPSMVSPPPPPATLPPPLLWVVITHGRRLFSRGGEECLKNCYTPKMALGEGILFALLGEG